MTLPSSTTPMTGQVNLPNDGQVTDVSTPESNDQTVPQSASPSAPPSPNVPPQGNQATGAPSVQPQQTPGQQPTGPTQGKQPDLSKTPPSPAQVIQAKNQVATQQAVAKASRFNAAAEALAGGPRYNYNVDAYGNMQKTKVPISTPHLALAIAMEALSGAATGFANGQGPAGAAKALGASFNQGQQQVQQQEQQKRQQATEDFARRAQVTETNARMFSNAKNLSNADAESIDKYIGQWKDTADRIEKEYPGYFKEVVGYDGLKNYNVTENNAIPYKRTERIGPDGKPMKDDFGNPKWDIDYLIIDPKFKGTGFYSPEELKNLQELGQAGASNDLVNETPTEMVLAMNKKSQAANWGIFKDTANKYWDTLDDANSSGTTASYTPTTAPNLPVKVSSLADLASKKYGVDSKYIKGIIAQESGGNPNALSPTGVKGIMQVSKGTAQSYGLSDTERNDPEKGVDVGAHYFSDLLKQYKNPKLALAAYYSGDKAIKNGDIVSTSQHSADSTNSYVNSIFKRIGIEESDTGQNKADRNDFAKYVQDNPTFGSAAEKFMGALGQTAQENGNVSYTKAIGHLLNSNDQSSVDAGKQMLNFLGGWDKLTQHDQYTDTQNELRKNAIAEKKAGDLAAQKQAADEAAQTKKLDMLNTLEDAKIPDNALDMNPSDVVKNLQDQSVTLSPEAIRDALTIAKYEAPISVASNKLWFKDGSMNQQDLLDIVKQFNPAYDAGNYVNIHKYTDPNSAPSKTIAAAAGVSNHLNMLLDAAKEINTNGNGSGQFPMLNRLANEFNYQSGGDSYSRLAALTNAVNGEMSKVLSGGFAPDKEQIEALMKNMTPQNSLQQINSLAKLYTGIMAGKITPYDETYSQLNNGRHLKTIPQSTTQLFQRMGERTPWSINNQNNPQNQKPQAQFQYTTKDGKQGWNGTQWVPIPGK